VTVLYLDSLPAPEQIRSFHTDKKRAFIVTHLRGDPSRYPLKFGDIESHFEPVRTRPCPFTRVYKNRDALKTAQLVEFEARLKPTRCKIVRLCRW
jgi:hypothetical protein